MPCGRVTNTTWRLTFTVASLVAMVMVKAAAAHRVLCRCHLLAEMFELQHGCQRNKNHVLAGSMTIAAQVQTRSAPSEMVLDGVRRASAAPGQRSHHRSQEGPVTRQGPLRTSRTHARTEHGQRQALCERSFGR